MKKLIIKISWIFVLGVLALQLRASDVSILTCDAYFTHQDYQGPIQLAGGVIFFNQATGIYTDAVWNFGDGNFGSAIGVGDTTNHFYATDGVYNVCLTVWDDTNCSSTFCSDVVVGNLADICTLTDCVFPGDANKDGEANFYDLLELGLGNGLTGPVRPNATIEWVGQLAPDWVQETAEEVNYKHLDCDGNGIIDENDAQAITINYTVMDAPNPTAEASAPLIHIEFDSDTIYVDDNSFADNFEITAHLKVGNADFPADNIYGLALYLSYPSDLVYEDSVFINYNPNSFFGPQEEVFWMPNNHYAEEQIDIGVTRNDGYPSSGHGRIGDVVAIINSDILDGRIDDGSVLFPISVNGVRMVDSLGNELPINLTNSPATLVFLKANPTATNDPTLEQKVKLFPNPATDKVQINLSDLQGENFQIFNNFGQNLMKENITQSTVDIQMKGWSAGVYFIKIQTKEGVVSKRFVLK